MKSPLYTNIKSAARKLLLKLKPREKQFTGNYKTWAEAKKASEGYDNDKILARAIKTRRLVLDGIALYERDLRVFHEKPYVPESLAFLLWVYSKEQKLSVLDFGGSFGTSYYQHQDFLKHLPDLHWSIVEQENYVDYGKKNFETKELKFFKTHKEATAHSVPNMLYLSGVLPYLPEPYEMLRELLSLRIPYILLDRNQFTNGPTKLTVQKTTKMTFPTSFPCTIFNKKELMAMFTDYEILREFRGPEDEGVYYGGCLLTLKE